MRQLCTLHAVTGVGDTVSISPWRRQTSRPRYAWSHANLLRRYGVTYEQFGRALEKFNSGTTVKSVAYELVSQMSSGISQAAKVARQNNMVRAFAIAPTASCSYRSMDADGFTCTPEIAPPIATTVDRDSGTFGVQTYQYGDVERLHQKLDGITTSVLLMASCK